MQVRFRYEATGPVAAEIDAEDYAFISSLDQLRLEVAESMQDSASWDIIPNRSDLEELWAEIQRLRKSAP